MKRLLTNIFILILLVSCAKEFEPSAQVLEGETWVEIPFGTSDNVEIITKSHQSYSSENMIQDLFIFIFDEEGNKVYDKFFTKTDRKNLGDFNAATSTECWTVTNTTSVGTRSSGKMRIKCPQGDNLKVYLVANLDSDRVHASSDLLSKTIDNFDDLMNFSLYLNVDSVERGNKFTSSGFIEGVRIFDRVMTGASIIQLKRVDAKIKFTFRQGNRPDENGQTIRRFIPEKYKIVNIPRHAYLFEKEVDATKADQPGFEYSDVARDFFDTEWEVFEVSETNTSGSFAFYMLENRLTPKKTPTQYKQRSLRSKDASGLNMSTSVDYINIYGVPAVKDVRNFEYANDFSTYILVQGTVEMDLVNDNAGQVLGADVEYLIHLGGDWTSDISATSWSDDNYSSVGSYDTRRNHSYNYIVTINSVNNIRVEVETSNGSHLVEENQPGAWGSVTIAKEEIAVCDAHYSSKTMSFHAANLVKDGRSFADDLTWSISTPFTDGKEKMFISEEETPLSGFDYQWVRFRLNKKDVENNIYYADQRRKYTPRPFLHTNEYRTATDNREGDGTPGLAGYHNDGVMDIVGLVAYMKEQAELFAHYQLHPEEGNQSDFDEEAYDPARPFDSGPKISVTVFVDEYYYERNPLSGTESDVLWKRFVNTNDRYLHILSNSHTSKDKESRTTGSVVTIQQKSIQSIYNVYEGDDLVMAWGLEHIDEFPDMWEWSPTEASGNTELSNGYLNSLRLWNLCGTSNTTFRTGRSWGTYMDIEVNNDTPQLTGQYANLRYSCMARNRDNNGDGVIDRDEMRWYTASVRQLINLFMGENCISMSSRLYNRDPDIRYNPSAPAGGKTGWMQHIVSSTHHGDGPTIIWGEEGIATGGYTQGQEGASTKMTVRCIRNLGMDSVAESAIITQEYDPIVKVTEESRDGHTYKVYDMSNLMPQSKRDYTSEELPFHFENDPENLVYDRFEAYYTTTSVSGNFSTYKTNLDNRLLSGQGSFCPDGYRTPNQREMAVMKFFGNVNENWMSRTGFSFGYYQTDPRLHRNNKTGFISSGNITLVNSTPGQTRCVRDIRTR